MGQIMPDLRVGTGHNIVPHTDSMFYPQVLLLYPVQKKAVMQLMIMPAFPWRGLCGQDIDRALADTLL